MKKRLFTFLTVIILIAFCIIGASAEKPENITFVERDPFAFNEHDVYINGDESQPRTIYCLQQKLRWPLSEDNVPYYEATSIKHLLEDDQIAVLQKLMFAGYPHNNEGILDGMYPQEAAADTQQVIWTLMGKWGIAGSEPYNYDDLTDTQKALIDFALNSESVAPPASNTVTISGSGEMQKADDGKWHSGALMITEPTNYKLTYEYSVPSGVTVLDKDKRPTDTIKEGEVFYLAADSADSLRDGAAMLKISTTVTYPTDVEHYMTDAKDLSTKDQIAFQTMLSVGIATKDLAGELKLSAKPESDTPGNPDDPDDPVKPNVPKTGDNDNPMLYVVMMIGAMIGLMLIGRKKLIHK